MQNEGTSAIDSFLWNILAISPHKLNPMVLQKIILTSFRLVSLSREIQIFVFAFSYFCIFVFVFLVLVFLYFCVCGWRGNTRGELYADLFFVIFLCLYFCICISSIRIFVFVHLHCLPLVGEDK